ncbi:MAG TPA: cysteine desulfurase family protein [Acidimicrobiales bacterium]|nr:cysteine desulfurase family protein [Acidimicrobiales bacterium]
MADAKSLESGGGAYLDHAATTPMRAEAVAAMLPHLSAGFANPSGVYDAARRARRAVDDARDEMAAALGCQPGEVVFTSGGTEADNLAVLGVHRRLGGTVVASAIEHHAVLNPARRVGARLVPATAEGLVDLDALQRALDQTVTLVSVMAVNNEVGTVQPIGEVVAAVRKRAPRALIHSDAVQAMLWCDVAGNLADCDLVSVSAHKFGGPKGVGALVVRGRAESALTPLCFGGGQERSLRPGTENVAGIVAMAAAATTTTVERPGACERTRGLRDRFLVQLAASVPEMAESVPRRLTAPGYAHVRFPGVIAEELLVLLDVAGVAASAGSACAAGAVEPSHVLRAMGWSAHEAREAVRFTLGPATSEGEIDYATGVVAQAVASLARAKAMGD